MTLTFFKHPLASIRLLPGFFITLSIGVLNTYAQVNDYNFSVGGKDYYVSDGVLAFSYYEPGMVFVNKEVSRDDKQVVGTGYEIGFPFYFEGQYFDRFSISANGFLKLGNSEAPFPISTSSSLGATFSEDDAMLNRNTISFAQRDVAPNDKPFVMLSRHLYNLPGERILNLSVSFFYPENGLSVGITFFEKDQSIQLRYAFRDAGEYHDSFKKISVGLRGNLLTNEPGNIRLLQIQEGVGTWANPQLTSDPSAYCDLNSHTFEPTMEDFKGWIYRFTPPLENLDPCLPMYFYAHRSFPNWKVTQYHKKPGVVDHCAIVNGNTNVPATRLEIGWAKNLAGEASYDILLGVADATPDTLALATTEASLSLPNLSKSTSYLLQRRVYDADGELMYTCQATFSTGELDGYCQPSPHFQWPRTAGGLDKIRQFSFNTINYNRSPEVEQLQLLPRETPYTTELQAGETYTFRLTNDLSNHFAFNLWLYLDLNRDGDWDFDTETTLIGRASRGVVLEKDITIPEDIVSGETRMRIKFMYTGATNANANQACGSTIYLGNRQDYIITLLPPANCQALSMAPKITDISCFGASDGTIDLDMEGGTTPYNIRWQKNEEDIAETSAVLSQLGPGTYRAFIEDAAGCKYQTDRMTVTLPLPLDAAVASTPTRCFRSSTGSIKLDITGGTAPYDVALSQEEVIHSTTTTDATTLDGLAAGQYNVAVIDHTGCTWQQSITLLESQDKPLSAHASTRPVVCSGTSTGSIALAVSGGNTPYIVELSQEDITHTTITTSDEATFDGLIAGPYTATVTDNTGCIWQQNLKVSDSQGEILKVNTSSEPKSCFKSSMGNITLSIAGGAVPYSVTLSHRDQVYTATTKDAATFNRLPVGPYTATVTDHTGCTWQKQIDISANLSEPLKCTYTLNEKSPGTISVDCSGGTLPYTYYWDANIATGPVTDPLEPGRYAVTIKDHLGCVTRLDGIRVTGKDLVTALPGPLNHSTYRLYPNPGSGKVWLISDRSKQVSVSISNASAQELSVFSLQLSADKPVKLHLPDNSHGVLLIALTDDVTSEVIRYVKK